MRDKVLMVHSYSEKKQTRRFSEEEWRQSRSRGKNGTGKRFGKKVETGIRTGWPLETQYREES
jgi:hypothetical protein